MNRTTSAVPQIVTACILTAGALAHAQSDIGKLAWLGGCWTHDGGERGSVEQWLPPAGETLMGVSRTVKQGKTVAHEFMQIRPLPDGRLAFYAQPAGKPPDVFPALRVGDSEVVFENSQHDFPQRIVYARDGAARLKARIEGMRNGSLRVIPFPMTRVSCDAMVEGK